MFEVKDKYPDINDEIFINFVKKCFLSPRKKLIKNLISAWYNKNTILEIFSKLNINQDIRGEDLVLDDFINIILALGL